MSDAERQVRRRRRVGERIDLLEVAGLDADYGTVQILFDVDFTVDDGEMVALLGVNGAGKSTLLKAISGTACPTRGSVRTAARRSPTSPPSAGSGSASPRSPVGARCSGR